MLNGLDTDLREKIPNWMNPNEISLWTSNVAMSTDLVNWVKYSKNPIVEGDYSSPITVFDGKVLKLYTMQHKVCLYHHVIN